MKMKPITFSLTISIGISLIFILITFWIFYEYAGSKEAAKDALSTTGSYFGAVATLGAAIIAAYLFNDWKIQHNKQVINNFGFQVYEQFSNFENDLSIYHQYLEQLDDLIDSYSYEVDFNILHTDNNLIYILNIKNKINELKVSFNSLYSKFQAYSIVSGTLDVDYIRYDSYLDTFNDNNSFDDELFLPRQNLTTWYKNYNETLTLVNKIKGSEIEKLLVDLKAK